MQYLGKNSMASRSTPSIEHACGFTDMPALVENPADGGRKAERSVISTFDRTKLQGADSCRQYVRKRSKAWRYNVKDFGENALEILISPTSSLHLIECE